MFLAFVAKDFEVIECHEVLDCFYFYNLFTADEAGAAHRCLEEYVVEGIDIGCAKFIGFHSC